MGSANKQQKREHSYKDCVCKSVCDLPRMAATLPRIVSRAGKKNLGLKKRFVGFLYEDRTQKYQAKAHEKHPMHGMPYLTEDKSPLSEGEKHHVKDEDKTDECHKSQLKV